MPDREDKLVLIDGSRIIIEACVRAGANVFIGYPITPANLLYQYGTQRFPVALAAPDEITTLQWMAGFSTVGKLPVTATSFPGFALMIESINMAYMMELPMVIIFVQRMGPSTGTATRGAQGDLLLLNGFISGGYTIPTFCISDINDCLEISAVAASVAVKFRTPVILLTSKENVMTLHSFNIAALSDIKTVSHNFFKGKGVYLPYKPDKNLVPSFLPVGNDKHQVRLTASTHDSHGILQHSTEEALANTIRLQEKTKLNLSEFTYYEQDEEDGAEIIIVSYGVTALAAREAVKILRQKGNLISHLIAKTLFPVPSLYLQIMERYKRIVIPEENYNGQLRQILFGTSGKAGVSGVNAIGRMITPQEIVEEVFRHE